MITTNHIRALKKCGLSRDIFLKMLYTPPDCTHTTCRFKKDRVTRVEIDKVKHDLRISGFSPHISEDSDSFYLTVSWAK